ncbi:MAG: four helix bundle protein [Deltaproteobacteria bacterium]|nr:four helix bundle protein [Deltaproteobacteria bacterium]
MRRASVSIMASARGLTREVYQLTGSDRFTRDYGLRDQMRRASVSIMANVAEGFSRKSDREFSQFLFIAKSSAAELQSHAYIALDQGYIDESNFERLYDDLDHTSRMISNLIKHLAALSTK